MNYNTTHTTTKQTESRGKIKPRKIGKEKIVCFLAIGRDKALEEKNHLFHFTLLFVTYEKKKKKQAGFYCSFFSYKLKQ